MTQGRVLILRPWICRVFCTSFPLYHDNNPGLFFFECAIMKIPLEMYLLYQLFKNILELLILSFWADYVRIVE